MGEPTLQIIISHVNTDFDALASMLAAKKIYPDAQVVISDKQDVRVKQFLNIYRDTLDFIPDKQIDWSTVTEIILVDVASFSRIGNFTGELKKNIKVTVYDHHPPHKEDVKKDAGVIDQVGAAVTLLIEEIRKEAIPISEFEATIFGLGIYTDTGFFTYKNTTPRDLLAASFLMEQGMNLEMIQRFSEQTMEPGQQELLDELFHASTIHDMDGLEIIVSTCQYDKFQSGLSTVTQKLLDIKGADAVITVVGMKKHVHIVGRANSDRITLLPLLKKWGGGGHRHAGSAMVKRADRETVYHEVTERLPLMLKPAVTAREMMASPVKTILPETTIEKAGQLMYRYGHSGYPIVKDGKLLGIITRRDLDKANHHGLGHAPVKAYMTTNIISITPETTLEEIQKTIIEHNVGRLPVVEDGELIGIVSRTNIIEKMHHQTVTEEDSARLKDNLQEEMQQQLPEEIYTLLQDISATAQRKDVSVYLIGGIVRDILLGEPNDDIDIVVEGDGIQFAKQLQADYGGEVVVHDSFGTATWEHPTSLKIDVTSSRLEYYDKPASLPDVETSTLKEDLHRRDFTINAMAIRLNEATFGALIDPFSGQRDLREKRIKILHNISFVEDPTRIFRAVRFETRFQFKMDAQTEKLALHSIDKVKNLSANRIVDEMKRLFQENHPATVIQRLFELQFWQQFGVSEEEMEESCAHASALQSLYVQHFPNQQPDWFQYFMIPFYHDGKLNDVEKFALTKSDTRFMQVVEELDMVRGWQQETAIGALHRLLKIHAIEAILFILSKESSPNKSVLDYVQARNHLPTYLTGADLMQLGLRPGPFFSKLFLELEVAILDGEVESKEAALIWLKEQELKDIK